MSRAQGSKKESHDFKKNEIDMLGIGLTQKSS